MIRIASAAIGALLLAAAAPAAPLLEFIDNQNGTGVFQVSPDPNLFPTPTGGSIAFEIEITGVGFGQIETASVNSADFPRANPGNFSGGFATGLNFGPASLTAAFGSDIFPTGDAVDALLVGFGGPATFTYQANIAQGAINFPFTGVGEVTGVPEPTAAALLAVGVLAAARSRV